MRGATVAQSTNEKGGGGGGSKTQLLHSTLMLIIKAISVSKESYKLNTPKDNK